MRTISQKELLARLMRPGALILSVSALTDARANKTGNPFPEKKIMKSARFVAQVGADYGAAVNRKLAKEGEDSSFQAEPLPWGEWEVPNKVISHKGQRYIRFQIHPDMKTLPRVTYRQVDGRFIKAKDAAPFLPPPSFSNRQADAGLDGAEKQIKVRTILLDNIRAVRIDGELVRVRG